MHLLLAGNVKLVSLLPKTFSNSPTSGPSDLLTCTFLASLYSPFGIKL
jgi:hypothetical protein